MYADDATSYAFDQNFGQFINRLECYLLIFGHKHEEVWADIGEDGIWETSHAELL